ncbi:endonuclease/exonuclease/phosphatase family protein [archaeon]|nr:endonuclease/exonuclease/phosphatase family protein [archaeon]
MKKNSAPYFIIILLLGSAYYAYDSGLLDQFLAPEEPDDPIIPQTGDSVKIAGFNIQIFGKTKREKEQVMNVLANIVREFDVVLVQEIRDSSETTAPIFLDLINSMEGPEYAFIRSERVGRTSSKEAYAYFYNTETVQYLVDSDFVYNDTEDVFEREPYIASFISGGFDFTLIGIHTKPDDAYHEIGNLTIVFDYVESLGNEQDIIVLGDFNADGSYFDEDSMDNPLKAPEYIWVVGNDWDTMTKTDWTYDRMVMTDYTYSSEYIADTVQVYYYDTIYGLNQTLTESVSDHYPIYAEFSTSLPDDD